MNLPNANYYTHLVLGEVTSQNESVKEPLEPVEVTLTNLQHTTWCVECYGCGYGRVDGDEYAGRQAGRGTNLGRGLLRPHYTHD